MILLKWVGFLLPALVIATTGTPLDAQKPWGDWPPCGSKCLESSIQQQFICSATDLGCICESLALGDAVVRCVYVECSIKEIVMAQNATSLMCDWPMRGKTYVTTVVATTTGSLTALAVLLRTVDAWMYDQFGWHDACALGAGIWAIPMNTVQLLVGPAGFGRDIWTVPFDKLVLIQKMVWLTQVFYWPITTLVRMSFLLLYLQIFPQEWLRICIRATVGLNLTAWAFLQFSNIFYCHPISKVWDWAEEHPGHCWNINQLLLAGGGVTVILDIIIIVLPVRAILALRLSSKMRLGVVCIFVIGIFTLTVSCIRIWKMYSFANSNNPTWDNVPGDHWTVLEANISVFCVCMPAMRRFVVRRWRRPRNRHSEEAATKSGHHADDDREIPPRDIIQVGGEQGETGSIAENPWERTVARSPSRQTIVSADGNAQLLPIRTTDMEVAEMHEGPHGHAALIRREGEVFEMHEGPQGQCALVRRDAESKESDIICKALNKLVWPDFDDDS